MHNYTLNNYLTDYQFNPQASDEEIMQVAAECEHINYKANKTIIDFIVNYSQSLEVKQSKEINIIYNLN